MRSGEESDGHKRTFTDEARRAQIIACAIDTLGELGYAQTSLARIAERAGVSKGVISYHFAGKDELLEQVAGAVYAAGAEYVTPRIMAEESAPARLAACLRANIEFLRDHGNHVAAVSEITANLRTADGAARFPGGNEGDELVLRAIEAILRKGQDDGDFRKFDTRTVAWVLRHAIDGVHQQRALDPAFDFEACAAELTMFFDMATRSRDA